MRLQPTSSPHNTAAARHGQRHGPTAIDTANGHDEQLKVDVELDARIRLVCEVLEALLRRACLPFSNLALALGGGHEDGPIGIDAPPLGRIVFAR